MHVDHGRSQRWLQAGMSVGALSPAQLDLCLAHLEAAERLMLDAGNLADLARLSLVIEMLRRGHGLTDRPVDMAEFMAEPIGEPCGA